MARPSHRCQPAGVLEAENAKATGQTNVAEITSNPAGDAGPVVGAHTLDAAYRAYGARVLRHAIALVRDRDAAGDAVQEVFLRALTARASPPTAEGQLLWLCRITTNVCLNWLRDRRRRGNILTRMLPASDAAMTPAVEAALTAHALMREVTPQLQWIIAQYFIDDTSQDELSALVGISRRTLGYRLQRFKEAARRAA